MKTSTINKRITNYTAYQKNTPHLQDSVWYDSTICSYVIDKRYEIKTFAAGDISIVDHSREETTSNPHDLEIYNDIQLQRALEEGRIEWANNNWFEISIYDKKEKQFIDVYDNVLDNLSQALDPNIGLEILDKIIPHSINNAKGR